MRRIVVHYSIIMNHSKIYNTHIIIIHYGSRTYISIVLDPRRVINN